MPDQPNAAQAQEIRDQDYIEEYIKAVERGGGSRVRLMPDEPPAATAQDQIRIHALERR